MKPDSAVSDMGRYLRVAGYSYEWIPNYPDTYPTMAGVRIWKQGQKIQRSDFINGEFTPFKEEAPPQRIGGGA